MLYILFPLNSFSLSVRPTNDCHIFLESLVQGLSIQAYYNGKKRLSMKLVMHMSTNHVTEALIITQLNHASMNERKK